MHETTRQVGGKILGIRGGVELVSHELISRAMQLERPWRMGNLNEDAFTCRACGFTIEPYMEKSLVGKQELVCQDCREEAKLDRVQLKFGGASPHSDKATVRLGNAMKHPDFAHILDKIEVVDLPTKQLVVVPRFALLGIEGSAVEFGEPGEHDGDCHVMPYFLSEFDPVTPGGPDVLDACHRCSWSMKQLREMSASDQGMICRVCRQELGYALFNVRCTALAGLPGIEAALGPFNEFLSRFALSVPADARDRGLQAVLTTFLSELLDRPVQAVFVFKQDGEQKLKLTCEATLKLVCQK
jgi:hypothetical protein